MGSDQHLQKASETKDKNEKFSNYCSVINSVQSLKLVDQEHNEYGKEVELWSESDTFRWILDIADKICCSVFDFAYFNFKIRGSELIKLSYEDIYNKAKQPYSDNSNVKKLTDEIYNLRNIVKNANTNKSQNNVMSLTNNMEVGSTKSYSYLVNNQYIQCRDQVIFRNKTELDYESDENSNDIPLSVIQKRNRRTEITQIMSTNNYESNSEYVKFMNKREIHDRVLDIAELNGVSEMDFAFFNFLMPGYEYIKLNKEKVLQKAMIPNFKETILNKLANAILLDISYILNNNMQILPIQISNSNQNDNIKSELCYQKKSKIKNNNLNEKIKKMADNQHTTDDQVEELPTHIPIFLYYILLNPKYNSMIEFTSREEGVFKFKDTNAIARLWGRVKRNQTMSYEKFSRAVRYYRREGIIKSVPKKRLTYRFNSKYLKNIHNHCLHGN